MVQNCLRSRGVWCRITSVAEDSGGDLLDVVDDTEGLEKLVEVDVSVLVLVDGVDHVVHLVLRDGRLGVLPQQRARVFELLQGYQAWGLKKMTFVVKDLYS